MCASSTQSEREQLAIQRREFEARELEVERTRAFNLNTYYQRCWTRSACPPPLEAARIRSSRDRCNNKKCDQQIV